MYRTSEEKNFLSEYNIDSYERPSVAADIAVFSLRTQEGNSYRNSAEQKLSLLLIKRGEHPYLGQWALPGGFLRKGETIEACAAREICEETGVMPESLFPIGVFSAPDRDPRGWIISHGFASVMAEDVKTQAGKDAADAKWFDVQFEQTEQRMVLRLSHQEIEIEAPFEACGRQFGITEYRPIVENDLAFDHALIIVQALSALRKAAGSFELALDFLPERFTLNAFQKVQETLSGISLQPANFRRSVSRLVEETEEYSERAGHRPAKLFRRKAEGNGKGQ